MLISASVMCNASSSSNKCEEWHISTRSTTNPFTHTYRFDPIHNHKTKQAAARIKLRNVFCPLPQCMPAFFPSFLSPRFRSNDKKKIYSQCLCQVNIRETVCDWRAHAQQFAIRAFCIRFQPPKIFRSSNMKSAKCCVQSTQFLCVYGFDATILFLHSVCMYCMYRTIISITQLYHHRNERCLFQFHDHIFRLYSVMWHFLFCR